ncbi:trypsin-like peptidase domain-containing protein [Thiohalocapsa sp. ML1]|uniref:trypsin-like peptidase domain-containing protein n=1 Tax=Thiohalocapsa sp. ML1 TaxID=1431688 RepID=UPI000731FADC|nr:trypsin-like peptidase domain-containing protein [Thiohalocapsa sp. ML1]
MQLAKSTDTAWLRLRLRAAAVPLATEQPAPGTAVASLHHPRGTAQQIALGSVTGTSNCERFDYCAEHYDPAAAHYLGVRWATGETHAGSSGAGLFLPDGRVLGGLMGGSDAHTAALVRDFYGMAERGVPVPGLTPAEGVMVAARDAGLVVTVETLQRRQRPRRVVVIGDRGLEELQAHVHLFADLGVQQQMELPQIVEIEYEVGLLAKGQPFPLAQEIDNDVGEDILGDGDAEFFFGRAIGQLMHLEDSSRDDASAHA